MATTEVFYRYRVNVSSTAKGTLTFDCTVEGEGVGIGDVLARSDLVVKELLDRYPLAKEDDKKEKK